MREGGRRRKGKEMVCLVLPGVWWLAVFRFLFGSGREGGRSKQGSSSELRVASLPSPADAAPTGR
jgi:hypothetical protein